jgi:hypothetical protein
VFVHVAGIQKTARRGLTKRRAEVIVSADRAISSASIPERN